MTIESPLCLVTPRDRDLFQALDRCPLTVRQLLRLSATFAYPFTTERRVQERLQALCAAGRVRQWRYATAGQGALSYYTLTPLGYRLLHGHDAMPCGRGLFGPVGVARQSHTQALAEVIVQLFLAAHRTGIPVTRFQRENAQRLSVGDESLYPDGTFDLLPSPGTCFSYFLELDNRTESIHSASTLDTWQRKVQFYEAYQDAQDDRFRLLAITTGGPERLQHMLECAAERAHNPRRSLVYGATLAEFLRADDPLWNPIFRNHLGRSVALLTATASAGPGLPLTRQPAMVGSPSCSRPASR